LNNTTKPLGQTSFFLQLKRPFIPYWSGDDIAF